MPRVFCIDQQINPLDYYDEIHALVLAEIEGAPPYVNPSKTGANYEEFCQIADDAEQKLAAVLAACQLTSTLSKDFSEEAYELFAKNYKEAFVTNFDKVADALANMTHPREKEYIIISYMSDIIGLDYANDFADELAEYECYKTLFDISDEPSSDEEGGVPICHCSNVVYEFLMRLSRAEGLPPD